jgi:hypothetical protein
MNYLDLSIHRLNNKLNLEIYLKLTQTDSTIRFTSNCPLEQKFATYTFYINRITLLITEQAKQKEWNTIPTVAENNGFLLHNIHNIKNKVIIKPQQTKTTQTHKKWVTFIYHSSLIHKVTNLFRYTNLNIA